MNKTSSCSSAATNLVNYSIFTHFNPSNSNKNGESAMFGKNLQRKEWRRLNKHVVAAQYPNSNPNLPSSLLFGADSQRFESEDVSKMRWIGPIPGDIAEIEAYCRIFRAAEDVHVTLINTLCDPVNGVCSVSYDNSSQVLEDKIVSLLGCMISLVNKATQDVLSGRSSSSSSSFRINIQQHTTPIMNHNNNNNNTLPPLATFRREIKLCCETLHVALDNFTYSGYNHQIHDVWKKLQRLKNLCYDLGFPRNEQDNYSPSHMLLPNWAPVSKSLANSYNEQQPSPAFWKGGQVTEEGLAWLIDKGFRTIVDLRAENVKDNLYQTALDDAVESGKLQVYKFPVQIGTSPSMDQVKKFSSVVSDHNQRPLYLHSKEGVWRTSAMVSRWRQYVSRSKSKSHFVSHTNSTLVSSSHETNESRSLLFNPPSNTKTKSLSEDGKHDLETNEALDNGALVQSSEGNDEPSIEVMNESSILEPIVKQDNINPFKSQIPPRDIFSRKVMSEFFKNKRISPSTFVSQGRKRRSQVVPGPNEIYKHESIKKVNSNELLSSYSKDLPLPLSLGGKKSNTDKDGLEVNESENMRGSGTAGVVRIQSRKKAEMFLVRTDGFSCTREKVTESSLAFTHPSTQQQMLMWKSTPKTVLLLKKLGPQLMEEAIQVASFLHYQEKMNVVVEPEVHDIFARIPGLGYVQTFYGQDTSDLHEKVDFVACLGGDGVILHASNLFRGAVPPIVSFNLGSLGFLTSHHFEDFKQDLRQVIHGSKYGDGLYITLRMRIRCEIFRKGKAIPGKVFDVLNEVVVDRGSSSYISKIECYENDQLLTKVQGDGIIVATPTGSTAYSTAAGGSVVHPNVPCVLFTPICPHSLSFRPVILPDSARLELKIPEDGRSIAWVSFDGKRRQQLLRGDSVRISMSQHPLPTVNKSDQTGDWFRSLGRCLNWNERLEQNPL